MLATAAALAVVALANPPASNGPPSKDELAAITARGRLLAEYDAAVWHASDAVRAKGPKPGSVVRYIGRKTGEAWVVAFGRLDQAGATFLIAYEAVQGNESTRFNVTEIDPPKPDTGFFRSAARSFDVALKDFTKEFRGQPRPYNVAALPDEMGRLWVYIVPAQTKPNVWPLGGDTRYLISPDGTKIVAKRPLHKSVIENEPPKEDGPRAVMGIHTHVLAETPEDTDVFHVLARKPAVAEVIVTKTYVFQVGVDGTIHTLGKAEELFKTPSAKPPH